MGDGAKILNMAGNSMYFFLAMSALWGLYCLVVVWARVAQKRFRNEPAQNDFLEALEEPLMKGDFDTVYEICEGDKRALPQMMQMAILNRQLGYKKARLVVLDRFQRDVLTDLEYRLNWVGTMIKTAPMLGLRTGRQHGCPSCVHRSQPAARVRRRGSPTSSALRC